MLRVLPVIFPMLTSTIVMLSVSETLRHCEQSEAINEHRIPRKSARKAMAKPQHSRALKFAIP